MGKSKRQSLDDGNDTLDSSQIEDVPKLSYEEQLNYVNPIASPMASKKLAKRLYKLVKSAAEHKTFLRHGLKDVQIALKKGETGLVILAGDVTPVDVMCHLPGLCEERNIPYVYTPSHDDLGLAMGVKRSCVVMMVKENPSYQEAYEDCKARVQAITVSTLF